MYVSKIHHFDRLHQIDGWGQTTDNQIQTRRGQYGICLSYFLLAYTIKQFSTHLKSLNYTWQLVAFQHSKPPALKIISKYAFTSYPASEDCFNSWNGCRIFIRTSVVSQADAIIEYWFTWHWNFWYNTEAAYWPVLYVFVTDFCEQSFKHIYTHTHTLANT